MKKVEEGERDRRRVTFSTAIFNSFNADTSCVLCGGGKKKTGANVLKQSFHFLSLSVKWYCDNDVL